MRSSSPGSDYDDYLFNLKKKTAGIISDFHIDGLSDLSLSEISEKKEDKSKVPSKFLKKLTKKDNTKINDQDVKVVTEKKKKVPKENVKKNIKKKSKSKISKEVLKTVKSDIYDSDPNISLGSISITTPPRNSFVPKLSLKDDYTAKFHKSDDDESSFGKDGRKFLKPKINKPNEIIVQNEISDIFTDRDMSSPRKSTLRSARTLPSTKKVTIADPMSATALNLRISLDKSIISSFESISDKNSNFCGQKILSLDYLENEELNEKKVNESSRSDSYSLPFVGENIMSIADLENEDTSMKQIEEVYSDVNSLTEILTLPQVTPRKLSRQSRDQSISEIITVPFTERSNARSSGSKQYSMEFEESASKDKQSSTTVSKKSATSYSSDFTKDDLSLNSESVEPSIKKKSSKSSKHLKYHWDKRISGEPYVPPGIGMQSIDPTPIAHYVVSPEALESVTAYSPCMILLTNMLRQQLQITTGFIETQRRLYDSMMSNIKPSYHYCTLDDTKEFIKLNKDKGLSMKEAELLMERDY